MALKWFLEKKGTMSGLLLAFASVGPLALSKVGAILCEAVGTQEFIYIGVAYAITVCISSMFVAVPKADWIYQHNKPHKTLFVM